MITNKKETHTSYTLGLDLGIASVGAALLAPDRILGLHVRTFEKGETAEKGESLNKIRRDSRSQRRRLRRRVFRMNELLRRMCSEGLIATPSKKDFADCLPKIASPWELRQQGLDRKLTDLEWAAVIYHLVKHRGFQSSRRGQAKDDKETGKMKRGIEENQKRGIEENQKLLDSEQRYRTIGELIQRDKKFSQAKRNKSGDYSHSIDRKQIEKELSTLFEAQRQFAHLHASLDFEQKIHRILMFRKPTLSGQDLLKMVGCCTFERGEKRAPKAGYRAERFRWLQKLNNLRIYDSFGQERKLEEHERVKLLDLPFLKAEKVTYQKIREELKLENNETFKGLADKTKEKSNQEKKTFFSAKYFHAWRKAYENAELHELWKRDSRDPDRLDILGYALTCYKEDEECWDWLREKKVEEAVIKAVSMVHCDKFLHLSTKALKKILPYLEQGSGCDEALREAKLHRYLPCIDKETIINPVVYRALNQARKLVNAIVREYGSPSAIHIELARDLNKSKKERYEISEEQKKASQEKDKLATEFKEHFPDHSQPSARDLRKYRLYRQQQGQCPYSQSEIVLERLLEENYVEIDHILPYSRSFDDRLNNQVLVLLEENRNKSNQTPFEYLGGAENSLRWQKFVSWVNRCEQIPQGKRERLLRQNFSESESKKFRERHLNDTRYISSYFKNWIEETHLQLAPANQMPDSEASASSSPCEVVNGRLTGYLRAHWGLLKERDKGDLHHALDAAVVAACTRSMVKRLADDARQGELNRKRQFPMPWLNFRQELLAWLSPNPSEKLKDITHYSDEQRQAVQPVRVSRMATHRNLGSAHKETIRSIGTGGCFLEEGKSAIKTPLTKLKLKDLPNIVGFDDPRNRGLIEAIRKRWKEHNGNSKAAFSEPLYKPGLNPETSPIVRSVKVFKTQKSGLRVRQGIADNGKMIRVDIFKKPDKKGKAAFYGVPVYVSDAVCKDLPNKAALPNKPEKDWPVMDETYAFLFSLYPNDWVCVKKGDEVREGYYSEFDRGSASISLYVHDRHPDAGKKSKKIAKKVGGKSKKGEEGKIRGIGIKTATSIEKYHVDFLGRLYLALPETRQPVRRPVHKKPQVNATSDIREEAYELA